MRDKDKTKEQLIDELLELRYQLAELKALDGKLIQVEESRKQTETLLVESEEKYRLLVENASEAILVVQDEMIKFANPRATEISGYSKDELASRNFLEFIHPDDREMVLERYLKRLMGEELPQLYSFRIIDKDRNTKWVELNVVRIIWEEKPATLNFLNDITEKLKTEEDLIRIQKLEAIGALAGGIAHEFNNILTGILGNISLAKMFLHPKDKAFERLTEAEKASIRAKQLTQQLLTFSRGGLPILKTASIADILKESVNFALSGSNVRPKFFMSDNLWLAQVDETQISQVFHNITVNAKQAMPKGGTVKVSAENVLMEERDSSSLKDGEYIKISIKDQGTGIPKEHLQKIFDPYFTTKQKGSGLGLAISYSIIKKHKGLIEVESKLKVGTTFHIYLPASPEKVMVVEKEAEEKPIPGKVKVLVMDDEVIIRDLAYQMLGNLGYEVAVAEDGSKAIELFKEAWKSGCPFDAVIMDLTVPGGMGGMEAIRELMEINPEVKAIVSSGYSDDPVMADYSEYGFSEVIAKPYQMKELAEVLNRVTSASYKL